MSSHHDVALSLLQRRHETTTMIHGEAFLLFYLDVVSVKNMTEMGPIGGEQTLW